MTTTRRPAGRGVVRLVVASPDGRRVLARPNGLAGWSLPTIPSSLPLDAWTEDVAVRAEAIIGSPLEAPRPLAPDAWAVTAAGRIAAAGNTWIGLDEVARLGADEAIVRRWAEADRAPREDGGRG